MAAGNDHQRIGQHTVNVARRIDPAKPGDHAGDRNQDHQQIQQPVTPLGRNLHKAFAARLGDAAAKAQAQADQAQHQHRDADPDMDRGVDAKIGGGRTIQPRVQRPAHSVAVDVVEQNQDGDRPVQGNLRAAVSDALFHG